MNKKVKVIISIVSCLILFLFGVYRLITEYPDTQLIPIIFAIGGFIGFIGGIMELKKKAIVEQ